LVYTASEGMICIDILHALYIGIALVFGRVKIWHSGTRKKLGLSLKNAA
jgi:hypothetical protein